jgi:RNA polymerase sigma factor (sigma-70 family)
VNRAGLFPSTRRSVLEAARDGEAPERSRALDLLIGTYWRPAYKYIRRKWGVSAEDAADLTQGFFTRALEKPFFERFDPEKGSFRNFLRLALDGFVVNERKAASRQKRDPGREILSLDFEDAEGELARTPVPEAESMEEVFQKEWTRELFSLTVSDLEEECRARSKLAAFQLFERYDLESRGRDPSLSYASLAREYELSAAAVTNALAFARKEFRRLLLARLRELCGSEEEFRREARMLLGERGN